MLTRTKKLHASLVVLGIVSAQALVAQCGGTERWPVKVGSDAGASMVKVSAPVPISIHDLVRIERPAVPADDTTRLPAERTVYVVEGRLLKFKHESGKTGDQDYHLVITDESLQFSPGGTGSTPVEHSVIAEVVNPECIAGKQGAPGTTSRFDHELSAMRTRFDGRFPDMKAGWNEVEGIPVRITAPAFFDRPHGQVGRALNGLELHPILDIAFLDAPTPPGTVPATPAASLLQNPGFENGSEGWVGSEENIFSKDKSEPAHSGVAKAWLGGYGKKHSDRLYQEITLPTSAHALTLAFFLHVTTEEQKPQVFDTLTVAVRRPNGALVKNLASFSNLNAAPGFQLKTLDLTPYRGQTIRLYFSAAEDEGSITSFVIDDVRIIVE